MISGKLSERELKDVLSRMNEPTGELQNDLTGDATDIIEDTYGATLHIVHLPSGERISFKSYIVSTSDAWSQKWNENPVYGRMDPIMTFQGTVRKINVKIVVPARSIHEGIKIQKNFSMLAAFQYPRYEAHNSLATGIVEPPLMRVKLGNIISRPDFDAYGGFELDEGLLCALEGFANTPEWEWGVFLPDPGYLIPKISTLDLSFTVLHEHALGWKGKHEVREGMENYPYMLPAGFGEEVISDTNAPEEIAMAQEMTSAAATGAGAGILSPARSGWGL